MQRFKGRGVRSFSSKWDDNIKEGAENKCFAKGSTGKALDLLKGQRDFNSALLEIGRIYLS